jgi:hypothetical protein
MTCHDAREKLSALHRGMDLTERALVHAHVIQCAECQKEREEQLEPMASSSTVAEQAALTMAQVARAGVARTAGLLTQLEPVRSGLPRAFHMLVQLRSPLMTASRGVARSTTDFVHAGAPRILDVLARLRELLLISLTVSAQAAMRVIEVLRAGVARMIALSTRVNWQLLGLFLRSGRAAATLIGHAWFGIAPVSRRLIAICSPLMSAFPRAGRTTTKAARAGATRAFELPTQLIAAGRALSVRAGHASPPTPRKAAAWPVRPLLKVSTGMVGLLILVAAIVFSAGERLSRDVRLPMGLEPSFAQTSTPIPVAAVQPAPVEAAPPEPRPVRVRPKSPEPARAAAALTPPTDATAQNGDASDPTAAIDWLLQGGRGRRQTESP